MTVISSLYSDAKLFGKSLVHLHPHPQSHRQPHQCMHIIYNGSPPHAISANVKVEESPALTDPGEGQEEEEEEPRISCGVPLHQTKGFVMSKSRAAVVKLPSIMQPNV